MFRKKRVKVIVVIYDWQLIRQMENRICKMPGKQFRQMKVKQSTKPANASIKFNARQGTFEKWIK